MTHRYALRFVEGERRGEVVALSGATTTFGRKPGNSVQVLDPSVSGKHAELIIDGEGVLLRDLGSTNGTRVNGERISERRLKSGDRLMLGTVDFVFTDESAAAQASAGGASEDLGLELETDEELPARSAKPAVESTMVVNALRPADAGEGVRSIGAEKLARSGRKNALAALGLVVIALGGGAAFWLTRGAGGGGGAAPRAVEPVAGNLLANGYSFESTDLPAGWSNAEDAVATFEPDRAARASGTQGLSADLAADGRARLLSDPVAAGRPLRLSAALASSGKAEVRAGLRFEASGGGVLPAEAFGPWVDESGGAELAVHGLDAALPATYDRVRVVIEARATGEGGTAMVDDVALTPAPAATPGRVVKHEDVELHLLGEPATAALLFKIDHALASGIGFSAPAAGSASSPAAAPLQAEADPLGMRLSTAVAGATLAFTAESGTAAGGIATTGAEGFKTHQAQFERAGVKSVVLGAGRELLRITFDAPCTVRGAPDPGGATFSLSATGVQRALVQVTFNEDKVAAEALAREARAAAKAGEQSRAIATWTRLIDEYPIDAALIAEAEAGRARILGEGLAAVASVRGDVERARFFRLLALFRECREKSLATARLYAGSEVEARAKELAASLDGEIELLSRDLDRLEARRLAEIHGALTASGQAKLAARVAAELAERFQVNDPAAYLQRTAAPASGEAAGDSREGGR